MASPAETRLDIRDFPGLLDDYDSEDIPDGTADNQVNIVSCVLGQMSTRKGYKRVSFEDG